MQSVHLRILLTSSGSWHEGGPGGVVMMGGPSLIPGRARRLGSLWKTSASTLGIQDFARDFLITHKAPQPLRDSNHPSKLTMSNPTPTGPSQPGLTPEPPDAALNPPVQVIAMHGWGGDSRGWTPWLAATAGLGWSWSCGERGYGQLQPMQPSWQPQGRRLLVAHSMGPLLVPRALLAEAELVVLLASFSRFVPPGPAGRRLETAIQGMGQRLEPQHPLEPEEQQARRAQELLQEFLVQAAAPAPAPLLPAGPAETPIGAVGRALLLQDLQRLASCRDLPDGFPEQRPVLIVEAGCDRIVTAEARALLRQRLPKAARLVLPEAGHALLDQALIPAVLEWVQGQLSP